MTAIKNNIRKCGVNLSSLLLLGLVLDLSQFSVVDAKVEDISSYQCDDDRETYLQLKMIDTTKLSCDDISIFGDGKPEPYGKLKVDGISLTTEVLSKQNKPEWNEILDIGCVKYNSEITMEVMDRDSFWFWDEECIAPLTILEWPESGFSNVYEVCDEKKNEDSCIRFSLQYNLSENEKQKLKKNENENENENEDETEDEIRQKEEQLSQKRFETSDNDLDKADEAETETENEESRNNDPEEAEEEKVTKKDIQTENETEDEIQQKEEQPPQKKIETVDNDLEKADETENENEIEESRNTDPEEEEETNKDVGIQTEDIIESNKNNLSNDGVKNLKDNDYKKVQEKSISGGSVRNDNKSNNRDDQQSSVDKYSGQSSTQFYTILIGSIIGSLLSCILFFSSILFWFCKTDSSNSNLKYVSSTGRKENKDDDDISKQKQKNASAASIKNHNTGINNNNPCNNNNNNSTNMNNTGSDDIKKSQSSSNNSNFVEEVVNEITNRTIENSKEDYNQIIHPHVIGKENNITDIEEGYAATLQKENETSDASVAEI